MATHSLGGTLWIGVIGLGVSPSESLTFPALTPADLFGQRGYFFQMMTAQAKGPELHVQ